MGQGSSIGFMYAYSLFFIVLCVGIYKFRKTEYLSRWLEHKYNVLFFLIGVILFKVLLAPVIEGFPNDIACFKSWSYHAATRLTSFYKGDFFCDYPPLYIYVLSIVGKIIHIFRLSYSSNAALILIKMPSIIAEAVTGYIIFYEARKHINKEEGFFLTVIYVLNPAVLLNATIWGQVDAFFAMLIILMIVMIQRERLMDASMLLALAIMMKPHGLIFGPILFFELIKRKDIRLFLKSFLTGMMTIIIVILPFSFNQNPLWIIKLYMNTTAGYQYASLNAFNFFALIGANLKADSEVWLFFSYSTWGYIFIVLITLAIAWFYFKSKKSNIVSLTTASIITGVFVLSSRMHERYLFSVIAILILAYIYFQEKRLLYFVLGFSGTIFLNTQIVLDRMLALGNPHVPPENLAMRVISLVNVLLFVYLFYVIYDITIKSKKVIER